LQVRTAVGPAQLSEPAYASTLAREFNTVEAEDAMKWWVLRPDEATVAFRQGDERKILRAWLASLTKQFASLKPTE
jgi:GH35 family endo-1,4-beta-xylanase